MTATRSTPSPGLFARLRQWFGRGSSVTPPTPAPAPAPTDTSQMVGVQLRVTADGLVRAAQAINTAAAQQSAGASEQAALIQTATDALEDFLSLSEQADSQARAMSLAAAQSADASERGLEAIARAISSMQDIRRQVAGIAGMILALAEYTRRIDDIITSVGEIATQSNLLALNASIEAARAGEHGRGFAVVADEVRSLAGQSNQAAAQVRGILAQIQKAMKETVEATEHGVQGVDAGVARTEEARLVLDQLASSVAASGRGIGDIYALIRQQTEGLEQIAISIDRIERLTRQNLAGTRMVETVSASLSRLADELQAMVEG